MNRTDAIRLCRAAPPYVAADSISLRCNPIEMAGPACHGRMQVVGHLFVVGPMALAAFARRLIAVIERRCLWVADQAVHFRMRGRSIGFLIDQSKRIGWSIFGAVAVQAKSADLAFSLRIIAGCNQMALQTRLVFVCKIGQPLLNIVALTAFFQGRGIEHRRGDLIFSRDLIMRMVALDTAVETLPRGGFLTGVAAFGDLIGSIFMTGSTLLDLKKIR